MFLEKQMLMMRSTHIIIACSSPRFRKHLKAILKQIKIEMGNFLPIFFESLNIDELEKALDKNADIAFIDSSLMIRESKRLVRAWQKTNRDCIFALLLSGRKLTEFEEVMKEMDKEK